MTITRLISAAILLGACCTAPALAAEAAPAGDAAAGRAKASMCQGCHGIDMYKTAFPEVYHVPRIGRQHAAYIVKALHAYQSGERTHPTMRGIAAGLTDKDMADLAAYYSSEAMNSAATK